MPTEQLTYAQIAERLSVSTEAARALVKRHRVPRSRSNDGKTLAAIDLQEMADFERERERADHMVTIQDRLIAELENLRSLLEAAQQSARPVTPRTWREMTWRERVRWLRTTG
jgi:hypothetical protein